MTRQSYATEIRIIRLMCTGRVDLSFVIRAFQGGADGVIIGGCWPGECHYVTEGNYDALGNMLICKKLLRQVGLSSERLRLEWISASEGNRFAEVMSSFADQLRRLGPLGEGEAIEAPDLLIKLESMSRLVPYIKLVEREKLRVKTRTEEAYRAFYESDRAERLFQELIAGKLAATQIMLLLEEQPLSTAAIAARLGLSPSEVSRQVRDSSRRHLIRYDTEEKCYARA